MSEAQPTSAPADATWNIPALERVLGPAATIEDAAFGAGHVFTVPQGGEQSLAVYPATGVLRLATHEAEVTLFALAPPLTTASQVIFQDEQPEGVRHLSITSTAGIAVLFAPRPLASHQGGFVPAEEAPEYLESFHELKAPPADDYGFDDAEWERLSHVLDEEHGTTDLPPA